MTWEQQKDWIDEQFDEIEKCLDAHFPKALSKDDTFDDLFETSKLSNLETATQ